MLLIKSTRKTCKEKAENVEVAETRWGSIPAIPLFTCEELLKII